MTDRDFIVERCDIRSPAAHWGSSRPSTPSWRGATPRRAPRMFASTRTRWWRAGAPVSSRRDPACPSAAARFDGSTSSRRRSSGCSSGSRSAGMASDAALRPGGGGAAARSFLPRPRDRDSSGRGPRTVRARRVLADRAVRRVRGIAAERVHGQGDLTQDPAPATMRRPGALDSRKRNVADSTRLT